MTAPTTMISGKPQFQQPAPEPDFGPDFRQTAADKPLPPPPKINQTNPPKPGANVLKNLGQNKKLRSDVRKLTDDDVSKLADWYVRIGKVLRVVRPPLGTAMIEQAEDCATSWAELADKNDKVRKGILAFVEGGAWGKVATAHAPILLAAVPESVLEKFFMSGMGMFAAALSDQDESGED